MGTGDFQSEGERLAYNENLQANINRLDEAATSPEVSHAEALKLQNETDNNKKKLYENSTDEENIARIEELLGLHEEMYEMSGGEYEVTLDSILTPWGEVPKWEALSSDLKKELLRIKEENPWIQDSDYESEEK